MRELATAARIRVFLRRLGASAPSRSTVYLVGGSTAVLHGWRESTIDIDLKLAPDAEHLLRAISRLKEELAVNVELASPDLFIPVPPGWEDRSPWESTEGTLVVRHFDLYAQALAKVERGHRRDLTDVAAMVERGLVEPARAVAYFARLAPDLYRFPAVDPASFRRAVESAFGALP